MWLTCPACFGEWGFGGTRQCCLVKNLRIMGNTEPLNKKLYAVSLIFTKKTDDNLKIQNILFVNVEAFNDDEAFGIAYNDCEGLTDTHQLFSKLVSEQECSHELNG